MGSPFACGHARLSFLLVAAAVLTATIAEAQEDVGHRVPAALGLYCGTQPALGLYLVNRIQSTSGDRFYDRNGAVRPTVGLHSSSVFNTLGASLTLDAAFLAAHATTAVAVFGGRTTVDAQEPPMARRHSGVGDLWVMPLELSWRVPHVDVVVDYAFYAPTGKFRHATATDGLGTGHWAHEFSAGTTLFLDDARTWSLSVLGTFAMNTKDRDVDITPGDVFNLEGGAGKRFFKMLDLGVVSFAHWQVSDNKGADVRAERVRERNRLFSVGGEADVTIRPIRTVLTLRYEYDVHAEMRIAGESLVGVLTFNLWTPAGHTTEPAIPTPRVRR
jgi:hypothetical protein